ncbi:hypothetical protein WR25_21060 isoform A [Diploscapter pachys]|uniref:DUF38 domain-containing protein n=1 Tax=Diploscapter pachys TaxID=2018661 RepID=A0A2A2KS59_9BILA|nr:hypothetical protein WR25_21060 isoform A [Diploscapter pachys]
MSDYFEIMQASFQSPEEKMFYDQMVRKYGLRQPRRIFGLKHDEVMLANLDSKSKHTAILLDALESTSTTTKKLDFNTYEVDFQLVLDFAKVLKPSCLQLNFDYNKKWSTLNGLVKAFPALFELNELVLFVPVYADGDSLLSHFSKFPPSLSFINKFFLHTGDVVKFLRTLVSTKFEEGSPAAIALKRIDNWTFQMRYETEIEEEETMNGYKLLSELVADIIPPDSENTRHIFELHLAVGGEQHVIYVKEEVNHRHEYRIIQLANRIENFNRILASPMDFILNMEEQMSSSDSDPGPDFPDADDDY